MVMWPCGKLDYACRNIEISTRSSFSTPIIEGVRPVEAKTQVPLLVNKRISTVGTPGKVKDNQRKKKYKVANIVKQETGC